MNISVLENSGRIDSYKLIPGMIVERHLLDGDIVLFNQSLFHAVYGGLGMQRRYIALKFAENPTTEKHIASLKKWSNYVFQPEEVFLNSNRPRIRMMIDGVR